MCVCVCVCVLSTHLLPLPGGARLRGHVAVVAQGARGLQVTVERDVELFAVTRWGEASEWTSCRQRCEAREERGEREPCNDDSVYACENNVRRECAVRRGCETPRRNTSFYCRSALGLDECGTPAEPQNPVGVGASAGEGGEAASAGSRPQVGRVADSPHSYHHHRRTHRALAPSTESPFPTPPAAPAPCPRLSLPETHL